MERFGKFITFEGGEGVGKSTQIALLAKRLQQEHGAETLITREPGGSAGAEAIRHVLLSGAAEEFGPFAEAVLFSSARNDHLNQLIRPALESGIYVLCDRFMDSTRVYQGVSGQIPDSVILGLEQLAVGPTIPDLTLVLDIDAKIGLKRAAKRRGKGPTDRFEKEALTLHTKRRKAFKDLCRLEAERCVLINANQTQKKVANDIWQVTNERLMLLDDNLTKLEKAVQSISIQAVNN